MKNISLSLFMLYFLISPVFERNIRLSPLKKENLKKISSLNNQIFENLNSVGNKVNQTKTITSLPFNLESCDQIVFFETNFILDTADYSKIGEGVLVLNAHFFNFLTKSRELISSILVTSIPAHPFEPRGTKDCIEIDDGFTNFTIIPCFPDSSTKKSVMNAIDYFISCSGGIYERSLDKFEKKTQREGKYTDSAPLEKLIENNCNTKLPSKG